MSSSMSTESTLNENVCNVCATEVDPKQLVRYPLCNHVSCETCTIKMSASGCGLTDCKECGCYVKCPYCRTMNLLSTLQRTHGVHHTTANALHVLNKAWALHNADNESIKFATRGDGVLNEDVLVNEDEEVADAYRWYRDANAVDRELCVELCKQLQDIQQYHQDEAHAEGHENGYYEGYEEGRRKLKAKLVPLFKRLTHLCTPQPNAQRVKEELAFHCAWLENEDNAVGVHDSDSEAEDEVPNYQVAQAMFTPIHQPEPIATNHSASHHVVEQTLGALRQFCTSVSTITNTTIATIETSEIDTQLDFINEVYSQVGQLYDFVAHQREQIMSGVTSIGKRKFMMSENEVDGVNVGVETSNEHTAKRLQNGVHLFQHVAHHIERHCSRLAASNEHLPDTINIGICTQQTQITCKSQVAEVQLQESGAFVMQTISNKSALLFDL